MKIGIFGTGSVGQAFSTRLTELGHEILIGTRNVDEKKNDKVFSEFLSKNPKVTVQTFAETAAFGELLINVSKGEASIEILKNAGEANLNGKILIDISNPLDFSGGMPPTLIPELCNTNSLGEEIQRVFPNLKVVKTLNTMWNGIMLYPERIGKGDHVNYICGNDEAAKKRVVTFLHELGWKDENLLDLGEITSSRATEAILPIWVRIYGAKKTGAFNFKIVTE